MLSALAARGGRAAEAGFAPSFGSGCKGATVDSCGRPSVRRDASTLRMRRPEGRLSASVSELGVRIGLGDGIRQPVQHEEELDVSIFHEQGGRMPRILPFCPKWGVALLLILVEANDEYFCPTVTFSSKHAQVMRQRSGVNLGSQECSCVCCRSSLQRSNLPTVVSRTRAGVAVLGFLYSCRSALHPARWWCS